MKDIPGVVVYSDDIHITAETKEEHLERLEKVLNKIKESGLRLKKEECVLMASSVEYLGHLVNAEGLHPLPKKV